MSEREKPHMSHEEEDKEVAFRPCVEETDSVEFSTAPTMMTQGDLQDVIDKWKVKFHQLSEGIQAIQTASEQFGDHMEQLQKLPGGNWLVAGLPGHVFSCEVISAESTCQ